jgi:hypothetical protein
MLKMRMVVLMLNASGDRYVGLKARVIVHLSRRDQVAARMAALRDERATLLASLGTALPPTDVALAKQQVCGDGGG